MDSVQNFFSETGSAAFSPVVVQSTSLRGMGAVASLFVTKRIIVL